MEKPHITEDTLIHLLKQENVYTTQVSGALEIARLVHKNQRRDDGCSYLNQHIFPVTSNAVAYFTGESRECAVIVALLHDVLEDTTFITQEQLRAAFGAEVVDTLLALQKNRSSVLARTQDQKHIEHRDLSQKISCASDMAKIVKVFDRTNNLQCTEMCRNPEKYERFLRDTIEYYIPIAISLGGKLAEPMQKEVQRLQRELSLLG